MPVPHLNIRIVQRSKGNSAVAGAAYQAGEKLFSEYDQKHKDHRRKQHEVVYTEIMLPTNAPPEYADRATLWNSAEKVEKQWNSQLARRFVVALPREVPLEMCPQMMQEYCNEHFVSKGMCCDFAIHDPDPPGHNPHCHIMLTMRAIDENGKWMPKSRKVYDLDENGERIKLPSGRWKSHKEDTVDWNEQYHAEEWRHGWEVIQNKYLELAGSPERVDMRSYERQGVDVIPTVHMGAAVSALERKGIETNIGNLNRDIKAANRMMNAIRSTIKNLRNWIADILEATKEAFAEMQAELATFKPMYLDPAISTDYCLVDGEITAILGTTHFVTDVYRECFYYMNAWLCDKELAHLHTDGFNVLRSGNWVHIPAFYNEDGSIGKRGVRALQTYFILAARYGFTVQFALGTVLLNQWDRNRSPIHDGGMREKCMTLIRSFVENFKGFPNVTLDIVNEPSYSMKGAWSIGRPSLEPVELVRFKEWLRHKYGTIENVRTAWGETAMVLKSFDDITMPGFDLFGRGLARTEQRKNHTPLADFFAFARNEFSGWTEEIRTIAREIAPDMMVTMGRDETLRIPAQQDEVLAGNIDMVCWHQWNYNSNIIYEYLMNRVRGKVCVAQEMGMYRFDDIRSGKRHTDAETADTLDKKLLYAAGNFVQWQAHDDPFMFELSENSLGLYRADKTATPSVARTKELVKAEKNMQHRMRGRRDNNVKIVSVCNTSYYFGVDNAMAHQGIKNHIYALYNCVKEQADFVPEHLFRAENASAIGNPKLIILPGMQMLEKETWNEILNYVLTGTVVLVSGCIDKEEHFAPDAKIGALDENYRTRKLLNFEKLTIEDAEYTLDFRPITGHADVTNLLDCGDLPEYGIIKEYAMGLGKILYCPFPVELSTNTDAVTALYQYAIKKANAQNTIYKIKEGRPQVVFTATSYEDCTVYTLINEGFADTLSFTDLRSGVTLSVTLKDNQGCKLWLDSKGTLLQQYGTADVRRMNV